MFYEHAQLFAQSIIAFHRRLPQEAIPTKRWEMMDDEVREAKDEAISEHEPEGFNYDNYLEETADVAFVALGTLELAGEEGLAAMRRVIEKNDAKTPETHRFDDERGKWVRRGEA